MAAFHKAFAQALADPALPPPHGVVSRATPTPVKRFAVYRNNVAVGLVEAIEARFPACRRIVGEGFFRATARAYAMDNPPRSPVMLRYGDDFPDFLAGFEPAAEISYLADVARIEAARSRAYHAADARPMTAEDFADVGQDAIGALCFELHPSLEIVSSPFPVVTIWAVNAGEIPFAPIEDWRGEDALIIRPSYEVEVRRLPPGAARFLRILKSGATLAAAASSAFEEQPEFDLPINLAALVRAGLATRAVISNKGE